MIEWDLRKYADKENSKVVGGFAIVTNHKLKIIIIPILNDLGDDSDIDTNFLKYKKDFVHEFSHYKTYKKHNGKSAYKKAETEMEYYNNHEEIDSYYKEAISKYQDNLIKVIKS